ncbi:MAG: stalk domain-containing protein, partial [Candidatus Rokuibacteriota bacterium]
LLDVPALIVGGRTLVPLRFVSEAMDARVDWDAATRSVFITSSPVAQPPFPPLPRPTVTPVPPPPQAAVVEGTVVRVDVSAQRILVQRGNLIHTFLVTPDTAITRLNVDTNQGGSISLAEVRTGDFVRVTADTANRAILVRVLVREISGRIDALTSRVIVLTNGQTFPFADDVRFIADGREVPREALRVGMEVTLRINPQTQEVTEVTVRGLVVLPTATPTPPATAVRITFFTHSAADPVRAGETITVTLRGSPGGAASFDIFGITTGVELREVAPGVYQGAYVVRSGDNVVGAAIFGHLRVGNQQAPIVQAGNPVTIDTLNPVITQRFPETNTTVNNTRPNILITYNDRGGSGISTATTRLFVNNADVTARATVTETAVAYNPPDPLSGRVVVRLVLVDRAGNRLDDAWAFTIAAVQGSLINAVTVNPTTPLAAGQVLTITVTGEPGAQATFSIEGVAGAQNLSMSEAPNQPGVYFGSYTVRAGDNVQDARVTVTLTKGGVTSRAEASARLTIVTAVVAAPAITSPAAGATVGQPLVIRGRATPGHQVIVRVDYRGTVLLFNLQGTYGQVATNTDAAGNWQVTINQSIRVPGAELTIVAWAVDPAGRRSEPTVVRVRQG